MNVYYLFIKCLSNDKTRLTDRLVPLFLQSTHFFNIRRGMRPVLELYECPLFQLTEI